MCTWLLARCQYIESRAFFCGFFSQNIHSAVASKILYIFYEFVFSHHCNGISYIHLILNKWQVHLSVNWDQWTIWTVTLSVTLQNWIFVQIHTYKTYNWFCAHIHNIWYNDLSIIFPVMRKNLKFLFLLLFLSFHC